MADAGWRRPFDDPIPLLRGRELVTLQDAGKYITLYRKTPADAWRMARDIWNSSNPPPGLA